MKRILFVAFILFFQSFMGCSRKDIRLNEISNAVELNSKEHNFQDAMALLIVPRSGCDGCITNSERFILDNLNNLPKLHVVFTATSSQKALRLKMGDSIYNHDQVFVDLSNSFYTPALMSVYPMVAYLEEGRVISINYVSPDSPESLNTLLNYFQGEHLF